MMRLDARIRNVLLFICFSTQIQNPIEPTDAEQVIETKAVEEEPTEEDPENEPQVIADEEEQKTVDGDQPPETEEKEEVVDQPSEEQETVEGDAETEQVVNGEDDQALPDSNEDANDDNQENKTGDSEENVDEQKTEDETKVEENNNEESNNKEVVEQEQTSEPDEQTAAPPDEEQPELNEIETSSPKTPFSDATTVINDPNYQVSSDNEEGSDLPLNPMDQIEEFPLSSTDEFVDQTEDELVALGTSTTEDDETNLPDNLGDEVSRQISAKTATEVDNALEENLGDEVAKVEDKEQEVLASDDSQTKLISESAVITGMVHGSPDEGRLQSAIVDRRVDDDDDDEEVTDDPVRLVAH